MTLAIINMSTPLPNHPGNNGIAPNSTIVSNWVNVSSMYQLTAIISQVNSPGTIYIDQSNDQITYTSVSSAYTELEQLTTSASSQYARIRVVTGSGYTNSGYAYLSGTTAISGAIIDNGGQVFNVKAYGAKGDGTAESPTACQDAINAASAAGGGIVLFTGVFIFNAAPQVGPGSSAYCLSVPSNVVLFIGPGSKLSITNALNAGVVLFPTNATKVGVIGKGIIDGNKANQTDSGVDGSQTAIYGGALTYWELDIQVQNCIRQGVYISNSSWGNGRILAMNNGTSTNQCSGVEDDANNFSEFNVFAINNLGAGFRWVGGATVIDNKTIATVISYGNLYGVNGVNKQGGILKVISESNTSHGIFLQSCVECSIMGYSDGDGAVSQGNGFYDYDGTDNVFIGPISRNSDNDAFRIYGSTNTVIIAPQFLGQNTNAIEIDSTSAGVHVSGGRIAGAVSNASTTTIIKDVAGYNPTGPQTAPTMPASGTALTNPFPFDSNVYVSGGTVTAIAVGGTATGLTSGAVFVAAGETITLTYSAAPTWVWIGN